jgi:hypothetical protein
MAMNTVWIILGIAGLIALVAILYYPAIILFYKIQGWIEELKSKYL